MPEPELRDNDVLVQVHAASANHLDARIRNGEFKLILHHHLPLILGHDVAGVVVKVGSGVQNLRRGDEVFARTDDDRIGTFAEFVAINESLVARKPKTLTMEEAASIPMVALTAWQALIEKANLTRGQKVLIHGGSGGVGAIAVQLSKHVGAKVAATASSANFELVRSLGADIVIDYKTEDFASILRDYDVVLDTRGGKTLEKSLLVLKPGGHLIGLAGPPDPDFAKGRRASWLLNPVMRVLSHRIRREAKRRHVRYSFLWTRGDGENLCEIGSLIDSGIMRPVIDRVFPFVSTKEAMAYLESGRAKGKVVGKVK